MTELKQYWLADPDGVKALIDGVAERARLLGLDWSEVGEPTGVDKVWTRHAVTGGRAMFSTPVLAIWAAKGWEPSGPPAPDDQDAAMEAAPVPFSEPSAAAEPVSPPTPDATAETTSSKAAPAGAKTKEKDVA